MIAEPITPAAAFLIVSLANMNSIQHVIGKYAVIVILHLNIKSTLPSVAKRMCAPSAAAPHILVIISSTIMMTEPIILIRSSTGTNALAAGKSGG